MNNQYHWQLQGPPNGQYAPPSSSPGYPPPHGYPIPVNPQQMMHRGYTQTPQMQNHPVVVISQAPIRNNQYYQQHERVQTYVSKPQVIIPTPKFGAQHRSQSQQGHLVQQKAQPQHRSQSYQERPQPVPQHHGPQQQQRPSPQQRPPPQTSNNPQVIIPKHVPKPVPQPGPKTTPTSATPPSNRPTQNPPTDYSLLLLSMAEEYINAAHRMGPMAALAQRQADTARYYKYMSTGLGCMESVLKNFRLRPRVEATLRLRYATLLFEETENNVEIEAVIGKGINICQRSRLFDLKYSMQHLLARVLFETNQKAALKSLDIAISEAETMEHHAWIYALRFLRVSLSLHVPSRPENTSAIQHLRALGNMAKIRRDRAVLVTCAAFEAMVYVRIPGAENIEHAQTAIASARSMQLQSSPNVLGQIFALVDYVDLACSLLQHLPDQANQKMTAMQAIMDQVILADDASDNGAFSVLIENSSSGDLTASSGGVFNRSADGRDEIAFSWLHKRDLYALGYYLSGITSNLKNEGRAEKYLREGMRLIRGSLNLHAPAPESIPAALNRNSWRIILDWHMRLTLGFLDCNASNWSKAEKGLITLQQQMVKPPFSDSEKRRRLVAYLGGIIDQGKGSTDSALMTYQSAILALPDSTNKLTDFHADVAILAALNSILILRDPSHPQHFLVDLLIIQLDALCKNHQSRVIVAAFSLIKAVTSHRDSITAMKNGVGTALQSAKAASNDQLLAISMNLMTSWIFAGMVAEQAVKSAKTGRLLAKRMKSPLWTAVADGLYLNKMQSFGLGETEDAIAARRELENIRSRLPEPVRRG